MGDSSVDICKWARFSMVIVLSYLNTPRILVKKALLFNVNAEMLPAARNHATRYFSSLLTNWVVDERHV